MKPKIAYVTHSYPYLGGYANIVLSHLEYLHKHFDVYFFYMFKMDDAIENVDISKYIKEEHKLHTEFDKIYSSAEIGRNLGWVFSLNGMRFSLMMMLNYLIYGVPLYFAPYFSKKTENELRAILERKQIRKIFAYGTLFGAICRDVSADYKYLYLCDSTAYLYDTLVKIEKNPFMNIFMRLNTPIYRRFERGIRKDYDKIGFISKKDPEWLGFGTGDYSVLPFIRCTKTSGMKAKKYDIAMAGRWDYLPNLDALEFSLTKILPKVRSKCSILVMGIGITDQIRKMLDDAKASNSNLRFTIRENADDYFGLLNETKLFLLPIRAGAGICTKLLDGLEIGMPVVTTPLLKESIDREDKCAGLVGCENELVFAACIENILNNADCRKKMGTSARRFYREKYRNPEKAYETGLSELQKT